MDCSWPRVRRSHIVPDTIARLRPRPCHNGLLSPSEAGWNTTHILLETTQDYHGISPPVPGRIGPHSAQEKLDSEYLHVFLWSQISCDRRDTTAKLQTLEAGVSGSRSVTSQDYVIPSIQERKEKFSEAQSRIAEGSEASEAAESEQRLDQPRQGQTNGGSFGVISRRSPKDEEALKGVSKTRRPLRSRIWCERGLRW